jgi:dihydroorotate dehydrogenase electron transfer subunit
MKLQKLKVRTVAELPKMVSITRIVQETPSIKTYYLDYSMDAKPGQFAMAWLPGLDEKPFTLTAIGKECAITVQCKGKFTKAMCGLEAGDKIGIRGPYGNGFAFKDVKSACIVAGGCGAAPILLLAEQLSVKGVDLTVINGARTGNECLFKERLAKTTKEFYITTDDGSLGEKGYTTDVLARLFESKKFDAVFGCGPEPMLKKVFEACEKAKVECQLNLERWMRCSLGICGACAIGKYLVCKDGPVFESERLGEMPEFGQNALLKSGREVPLKEFAEWRQ